MKPLGQLWLYITNSTVLGQSYLHKSCRPVEGWSRRDSCSCNHPSSCDSCENTCLFPCRIRPHLSNMTSGQQSAPVYTLHCVADIIVKYYSGLRAAAQWQLFGKKVSFPFLKRFPADGTSGQPAESRYWLVKPCVCGGALKKTVLHNWCVKPWDLCHITSSNLELHV